MRSRWAWSAKQDVVLQQLLVAVQDRDAFLKLSSLQNAHCNSFGQSTCESKSLNWSERRTGWSSHYMMCESCAGSYLYCCHLVESFPLAAPFAKDVHIKIQLQDASLCRHCAMRYLLMQIVWHAFSDMHGFEHCAVRGCLVMLLWTGHVWLELHESLNMCVAAP